MTARNAGIGNSSASSLSSSSTRGVIRKYTPDPEQDLSLHEMKRQKCDVNKHSNNEQIRKVTKAQQNNVEMATFGDSSFKHTIRDDGLRNSFKTLKHTIIDDGFSNGLKTVKRTHASMAQYGNAKRAKINKDVDVHAHSLPKKPHQSVSSCFTASHVFSIIGADQYHRCAQDLEQYVDDTDKYHTTVNMIFDHLLRDDDDENENGIDCCNPINNENSTKKIFMSPISNSDINDIVQSKNILSNLKPSNGETTAIMINIDSHGGNIEKNTDDAKSQDEKEDKYQLDDMVVVEDIFEKSSPFCWPPTVEDIRGYDIDVFLVQDDDEDDMVNDIDNHQNDIDKSSMDMFDDMVFVEDIVEKSAGYIHIIEAN